LHVALQRVCFWSTLQLRMQRLKRFVVWLLEMICGALGTGLVLFVLAFVEAAPGSRNDFSIRMVLGMSAVVLTEFVLTGYLVTTAIFGIGLRDKGRWLYPAVTAVLYLIHSSIFFVGAGNPLLLKRDLIIQCGGACLASGCAWMGNSLLVRWTGKL
jgi:hypothetical protein